MLGLPRRKSMNQAEILIVFGQPAMDYWRTIRLAILGYMERPCIWTHSRLMEVTAPTEGVNWSNYSLN